jgi:Mg2+ and Co2+ transporter CorA
MNIRLPLAYHPRAFAIIMGINIVLMVGSVVFFIIYRRRIE